MKGTRAILVFSAFVAAPVLAETPQASPAAPPRIEQGKIPSKGNSERTPSETCPSPQKVVAPGAANMVVTKDPETGELRPATPAEREKLLGRRPLVARERTVVTLPDGSLMVEMGEADMSYAVATKRSDGSVKQTCVHGADAAAKNVATAAPAAVPAAPPAPAVR